MIEYRCKQCQKLLLRSDGKHGRVEIVCSKCQARQTIYLGGYRKLAPKLTLVGA